MRTIVVDHATDLATLSRRLAVGEAQAGAAAESLKRLNPHLGSGRLPAGTVVAVPDEPTFDRAAVRSRALSRGEPLAAQLRAGIENSIAGSLHTLKQHADERSAIGAVLKTAPLKRQTAADAELKRRAEAFAALAKKEQVADRATEQTLHRLHTTALAELERLFERLR